MPDLTWWEALLRLALAAGLGGLIGAEREIRAREAGLRTHLLVATGSALFTVVSAYAWRDWTFSRSAGVTFDPTRIAAQIVTGVGFLGAGAILVRGRSVHGLTTAATLWVVAAIGMAAGAGSYAVAAGATALVLFGLWPLRSASRWLRDRYRPSQGRLVVRLRPGASPAAVLGGLEEAGLYARSFVLADANELEVVLREPRRGDPARAAELLSARGDVAGVRWSA